jgi:hypothetical protein
MKALLPSVRASGGTPAGMPDFRPLNRSSPKEFSALLRRSVRPALFQVWVDANGGGSIPIGPKCPEQAAGALADAIQVQIGLGRERTWRNPRVALVGSSLDG